MNISTTKHLTDKQLRQINDLWDTEFQQTLNGRFPLLLDGVSDYCHYIVEQQDKVLAWAAYFRKDEEVRFSIIVAADQQGNGIGKQLVDQLKNDLPCFYGWVVDHNNHLKADGTYYLSPLQFYINQGFEILHDQRIDNEMLSAVKIRWR
jgi:GNAT superfamily N-acetyltransferase